MLGLVEGGFVAVGRAVAEGALAGDFGVVAGLGAVAVIESQAGEEEMEVRLLQSVLAAVGDGQGFFRVPQRFGRIASQPMPLGPGQQDVRFHLHQVDASAAGERVREVAFGLVQARVPPCLVLLGQVRQCRPLEPLRLDKVPLMGEMSSCGFVRLLPRLPGGLEGRAGLPHQRESPGAISPHQALPLRVALLGEDIYRRIQLLDRARKSPL